MIAFQFKSLFGDAPHKFQLQPVHQLHGLLHHQTALVGIAEGDAAA